MIGNKMPPTGGSQIPIEVGIHVILQNIQSIQPNKGTFTANTRHGMVWSNASCYNDEATEIACGSRIDDFFFIYPVAADQTTGKGMVYINDFENKEIQGPETARVDYTLTSSTFKQSYDMATYPYEAHKLRMKWLSFFSNNVVNITSWNVKLESESELESIGMPQGWSIKYFNCWVDTSIHYDNLFYDEYICESLVYKVNSGWFWTAGLYFIFIMFILYLSGLGMLSKMIAESRDNKDKVRSMLANIPRGMGIFSIGLALCYVIRVQPSPYDMPLEYWPSLSASTLIHILGLSAILIFTIESMLVGILSAYIVQDYQFPGNPIEPYALESVPTIDKCYEDEQPLLIRKNQGTSMSTSKKSKAQVAVEDNDIDHELYDKVETIKSSTFPDVVILSNEDTLKTEERNPILIKSMGGPGMMCDHRRLGRDNRYDVLSLDEAKSLQLMAKLHFAFRTILFAGVMISSICIISIAHRDYQDMVDS